MLDAIKIKQESTNSHSLFYRPATVERFRCLPMSRNVLLEKIKQAEAVASAEVEKAEQEQISANNRIPLDREELISKERKLADKKSKKEINVAMEEINGQKTEILKKGKNDNLRMKSKAEDRIDNASQKFVDTFLESLA